jgi:hypothetical protein
MQAECKQNASRMQAECKQNAASNVYLVKRIIKYNINFINQGNIKIIFFLDTRPQNNEIIQLLKVMVMPNLFFFSRHT